MNISFLLKHKDLLKHKEKLIVAVSLILLLLVSLILHFTWQADQPAKNSLIEKSGPAPVSRGASISREELYLMARVIEGEAADEPYTGKVAVGAVIINRTQNADFPKSITRVVFEPDAFEAVTNGQYNRPVTPQSVQAARDAVNGADPTGNSLYYWNPEKATSTWVWSRPISTSIGRHIFAR